ncbi:hypothetical protein SCAR479_10358 [Seiridium cardinale]|uniref:Uncharacterized protein n=1 Tax=Seiridium cardinale TaxID=138064 RepID=A0ABR2XGU6_9PEZI
MASPERDTTSGCQRRQEFLALFRNHQLMVVIDGTGTGKTTQIPQFILADDLGGKLMIACTQPRRIAASSMATRVTQETDVELGDVVGFGTRFEKMPTDRTRIRFLTDGLLVAESSQDKDFTRYSCIIVDEAHERSLQTDILLASPKTAIGCRPYLKVITTSALGDAASFCNYFGSAPLFRIEGRRFKVEDHDPVGHTGFSDRLGESQDLQLSATPIYRPASYGEEEIEEAVDTLSKESSSLEPIPLYASLTKVQQNRIFAAHTNRRCIVTTNIAETSITIPDVTYIIDCGLSRQTIYNPRARMQQLILAPISQASAIQRAGRAERLKPGQCIKLYTKSAYDKLPASTCPAILNSKLAASLLYQKNIGYDDFLSFDWIQSPAPETLFRGMQELVDLGFLGANDLKITENGKHANSFPVDPIWYSAIDTAGLLGVREEILSIAAFAALERPSFTRPRHVRFAADIIARPQFAHPLSDHIAQMNVFHAFAHMYDEKKVDPAQWCHDHFINMASALQATSIGGQLRDRSRKRWGEPRDLRQPTKDLMDEDYHTSIREALAIKLVTQSAVHLSVTGKRLDPAVHIFKSEQDLKMQLEQVAAMDRHEETDHIVSSRCHLKEHNLDFIKATVVEGVGVFRGNLLVPASSKQSKDAGKKVVKKNLARAKGASAYSTPVIKEGFMSFRFIDSNNSFVRDTDIKFSDKRKRCCDPVATLTAETKDRILKHYDEEELRYVGSRNWEVAIYRNRCYLYNRGEWSSQARVQEGPIRHDGMEKDASSGDGEGLSLSTAAMTLRTARTKQGLSTDRVRGDDLDCFPIERVRISVIWAPMVVIGLLMAGYGWALQYRQHIATTVVLQFFAGLALQVNFSAFNTLLVDINHKSPAAANASTSLIRCAFAAIAVAYIEDFIQAIGVGWAFKFLDSLSIVVLGLFALEYKNGMVWRQAALHGSIGTQQRR